MIADPPEGSEGPTGPAIPTPGPAARRYAADRELSVEQLQLATSADAGADPRRVVGYRAFLLAA